MNEINVLQNEGQLVVSSREVAKHFNKRHDKLTHEIKRMYGDYVAAEGTPKMVDTPLFFENKYVHSQNGQTYVEYLMPRDGFTLLAMGFTGKEALEWKLKYIEAFNSMEKQLRELNRDSYMIDDPIERAKKWIEERKERDALAKQVEEAQPSLLFTKAVSGSSTSILVGALAKLIKQNGVDMGQKRLFAWMRENGFLIKSGSDRNMPTQKSMNANLFEVREGSYIDSNGKPKITRTPLVTGKGQIYFINRFMKVANIEPAA